MMNARSLASSARAPLALAAAAFACGILVSAHLQTPARIWGYASVALAVCAILAGWKRSMRLAQAAAVLAFIAAGAFARFNAPAHHLVIPPHEFLDVKGVSITGHLTADATVPSVRTRERFDVESESLEFKDQRGVVHRFTQPTGVRVSLYSRKNPDCLDRTDDQQDADKGPECHRFGYGERVRFPAQLHLPRNFRDPDAFDYEGYLHGLGIFAVTSANVEDLQRLPGNAGSRLGYWHSAARRSIVKHITSSGLWNRTDSALLSAMLIGYDSLLFREVREEFQQTGVYHLLVVSGMNVGLLAFAVFWLARRLRAPDWLASVVTLALAVFYAQVAGMGVPIQRAVLMLSLFLGARLLYRGSAPLNATGFAALAVLVWAPQALFEAGFQLTFLALLAIFGISVPILDRTSEPCRRALRHPDSTSYDLNLPPRLAQLRLDLRLIAGRLARFIGAVPARWLVSGSLAACLALYDLVVVSTITQAVLVVPMRAYFHRAAIIGVPANLLVLPLAGLLLNSAVAAIALSYVSLTLARLPALLASACLHWTLACLDWLSRFHITHWRAPDPGFAVWLLAAAAIAVALAAVRRRRVVACAGLAVLMVSAGFAAFAHSAPQHHSALEITVIDVGQGDSILVVAPDGATLLVDGGGSIGPILSEFDFGEDVVSPYLWSRGVNHLDVVVLTHAHGDHIGGLASVIQNFHPAELWLGINPETAALNHVMEVARENEVAVRKHTAGERLGWHGAEIRVLSPPANWQPKPEPKNDDSLALEISYGKTSALLAGDLEKKMERFVAGESPHADVLKVAHHGSNTSTIEEFLNAVHPEFAAISVGAHNAFGHPRLQVLARLQAAHVRTYRTDMLGLITFLLDGKTVTVKTAADKPYR